MAVIISLKKTDLFKHIILSFCFVVLVQKVTSNSDESWKKLGEKSEPMLASPLIRCWYEGHYRDLSQPFQKNCETCECQRSGHVVCDGRQCPPFVEMASNDISEESNDGMIAAPSIGCWYEGYYRDLGQPFQKNCETCECQRSGQVVCDGRKCPTDGIFSNKINEFFSSEPEIANAMERCWYDGKYRDFGMTFESNCQSCECLPDGQGLSVFCYGNPCEIY